jgi:hypothetical protein
MAGNLIPITKSGDQLYINFKAFRENRLPCTVRIRDMDQDPAARVAFMKEPKVARGISIFYIYLISFKSILIGLILDQQIASILI